MLCSLILPAVLLANQAMALNFTYAYIPGFFAQDDFNANATAIGPVGRTRLRKSSPEIKDRSSLLATGSIWFARFEPWALGEIPARYQGLGIERWMQ